MPETRARVEAQVFATSLRAATANSDDQLAPAGAVGVRITLDITATAGTSETCDIKVQCKDAESGNYVDLPGAAFAQKSATGTDDLVIYPGVAETANRSVSDCITKTWRAVYTLGGSSTPSFTFSLGATYLPASA